MAPKPGGSKLPTVAGNLALLGTAGALLDMLAGTPLPKADPGKCRSAAESLRAIGNRLAGSQTVLDPVFADIVKENRGKSIDGFSGFYKNKLHPWVPQVATYARNLAQGCDDFANAVEKMTKAQLIIEANMWVNIAWTAAYGWATGFAEIAASRIAVLIIRAQANELAFRKVIRSIVMKFFHYVIDAIGYGAPQQLLQFATIKFGEDMLHVDNKTMTAALGYDPLSAKTNAKQFLSAFGAGLAFDAAIDVPHKLPFVGKYLNRGHPYWNGKNPWKPRLAGLASRMLASNAYTAGDNAVKMAMGDKPWSWSGLLPGGGPANQSFWNTEEGKMLAHVPRIWIYSYEGNKWLPEYRRLQRR